VLLSLALTFDLGLLAYFKYTNFFLSSIDNAVGTSWIANVVLPVGISFYTFMAISYVVDTYRGQLVPASFARFAVFQAFFPHLVAGPIVRASELLPQLETPRDPRKVDVSRAFFLIVSGLFLKVVIANHLAAHLVDAVFAAPNRHSSLEVLVGVYGYAVQIFADFCGYTNIAIGVALLLGFEFPQNFNSPYAAVSLQDFWRRWHMTLSRWLRDYLYISLGGNRKGRLLTYRNLLLTMVLGGLWHGAAWTFVAWGAIHGMGLSVERAFGWRPTSAAAQWFGRILTFHVVCFGWIFFRADSFGRAGTVLERLFTAWGQPSPLVTTSVVLAIVVGIAGQYVRTDALASLRRGFGRLPVPAQAVTVAVSLMLINTLGPEGVAPFIYFRF
jgi:D-alanyl-lipoteichoic acid acyltransferase DltB (MBOAT superfamily)